MQMTAGTAADIVPCRMCPHNRKARLCMMQMFFLAVTAMPSPLLVDCLLLVISNYKLMLGPCFTQEVQCI